MTQPVFDVAQLERILQKAGSPIPVIASIWPLTSLRNAEFLANEVPGVEVPAAILDRMRVDMIEALGQKVTVVPLERNVGSYARTLGVERAGTEFVAFADDDSWWAPGALARAAAVFDAHPRLGLIAGSIAVGPEERPDPLNAVLAASPLGIPTGAPGPALGGRAPGCPGEGTAGISGRCASGMVCTCDSASITSCSCEAARSK